MHFIPIIAVGTGLAYLLSKLVRPGKSEGGGGGGGETASAPGPGVADAEARAIVSRAYGRLKAGTAGQGEAAAAILLARRSGWKEEADLVAAEYRKRWPSAGTSDAALANVVRLVAAAQKAEGPAAPPPEGSSAEIVK